MQTSDLLAQALIVHVCSLGIIVVTPAKERAKSIGRFNYILMLFMLRFLNEFVWV